jgi:DNA-binding NtrC family response regulator
VPVLLVGEQGTGKELIARLIHAESKRTDSFMRANCRAEAVAIELFGSEKGGAITRGRLESAGRGTLFLDGVAELPMPVQAKLVRALDEGVFEREGGTTTIPFTARVVGATHRSVHELTMDEKKFSPQLKYHFNVVVPIPPLRERGADIPALALYFAEKNTRPGDVPKRIDDAALQALATYAWPGNVRELAHIVARAVALSSDDEQVLGVDDFTFRLDLPTPGSSPPIPAAAAAAAEQPDHLSPREEARANETIELRRLLLTHGGNVARAARALGVPRTTLLSRAKKLGLLA